MYDAFKIYYTENSIKNIKTEKKNVHKKKIMIFNLRWYNN